MSEMDGKLGYVLDEVFVQHQAPSGHPERPARAEAVRDALGAAGIAQRGSHVATRPATDEELVRVHSAAYLDALTKEIPGKSGWLDADTYFSPRTWEAARAAAGSTAQLALDVLDGRWARGIAVVRPPGHHATQERAMGFCLLNNAAVAAAALRAQGAARVAILDWDVHHGNGTQDIFWADPSVLYCSTHQMPLYPGTGSKNETGAGNIINAPLSPNDDSAAFRDAVRSRILPALHNFRPDLVIISAGFDAHYRDPLAQINLVGEDFDWITGQLMDIAGKYAGNRVVSVLEGGYDLEGLAESAGLHICRLMKG